MLSDLETYRAAQATIRHYGDGAGLHMRRNAPTISWPMATWTAGVSGTGSSARSMSSADGAGMD
jgi:hypothetical protein